MASKPSIACFITAQLGKRMQYFNKRLEALVFKDARRRIIEAILDLNENHGDRVGLEYVVRRFITHQEIANLSATSRQTVTSVLNDLRNSGFIKFNRRRLLIQDLDALKELI
jgi:CRP-like cAMP-binding protein